MTTTFAFIKSKLSGGSASEEIKDVLTNPELLEIYIAKYNELRAAGEIKSPGVDFEGPCGMKEQEAISSLRSKVASRVAAKDLNPGLYPFLSDENITSLTPGELESIGTSFDDGERLKKVVELLPGLGHGKICELAESGIPTEVLIKLGKEKLQTLSVEQICGLQIAGGHLEQWRDYLIIIIEKGAIENFLSLQPKVSGELYVSLSPEIAVALLQDGFALLTDLQTVRDLCTKLSQTIQPRSGDADQSKAAEIKTLGLPYLLHCEETSLRILIENSHKKGWADLIKKLGTEYLLTKENHSFLSWLFNGPSAYILANIERFTPKDLAILQQNKLNFLLTSEHPRLPKLSKEAISCRPVKELLDMLTMTHDPEFEAALAAFNDPNTPFSINAIENQRNIPEPELSF